MADPGGAGSERSFGQQVSKARRTAWTCREDQIIADGIHAHGHRWSKIAAMLPRERTDDAVRNRWQRLSRRKQPRRPVLQRQLSGGSERGEPLQQRWTHAEVAGRTAAALTNATTEPMTSEPSSSRAVPFQASMEDQGKHGDMWTPEEDEIIDTAFRVQGLRWNAIAAKLPGRTDSACRNRWVRNQKRQLAATGMPIHRTAEVFAALRAAGKLPTQSWAHSGATDAM